MKQFIKVLPIALLTVMGSVMAADTVGRSFFLGNTGRTISNGRIVEAGRTHLPDQDAFNGVFSVQQHYSQNFNQSKIGKYHFFNGTNQMIVRGTVNAAAAATDIFAPNLSIGGVTYNSTITLNPSVSTATTDLRLAVGLDEFVQGLHVNVSLPIVWSKWDPKLTETVTTAAGAFGGATANWFSNAGGEASTYANAVAALKGNLSTTTGATIHNTETMNYGKIDGSRSETAVGNCVVELGYDFISRDNAHFAVGLHGLFNGGKKSDAVYMFEPNIGTAGRHGVGASVNGHLRLWEADADDVSLTGHLDAQITHLFDATMRRSYDSTRHGVGSRYLQVKVGTATPLAAATSNDASYINYSSLRAKIGIDVMYDATLMVRYQNGGLCCDLGYQAWGHSAEKHKGWVDSYTTNFLGAKGLAAANPADWLNADVTFISTNVSITGTQPGGTTAATTIAGAVGQYLTLADLNINSGLNPSAMTNTVFGNIGYEWLDSDWRPFIGAGAAGEFANNNTAFDQWHVFVNGGVSF